MMHRVISSQGIVCRVYTYSLYRIYYWWIFNRRIKMTMNYRCWNLENEMVPLLPPPGQAENYSFKPAKKRREEEKCTFLTINITKYRKLSSPTNQILHHGPICPLSMSENQAHNLFIHRNTFLSFLTASLCSFERVNLLSSGNWSPSVLSAAYFRLTFYLLFHLGN